jgi:hypothetical protein
LLALGFWIGRINKESRSANSLCARAEQKHFS